MKTIFSLAIAALTGFPFAASQAQDVVVLSGGLVECAPPVVYEAPVIYQVPVVYQAPVLYQAPVTYETPMVGYAGPAQPNIVYIGGSGACQDNGYSGCARPYGSPVIYFGRGESALRGYQFTHPR